MYFDVSVFNPFEVNSDWRFFVRLFLVRVGEGKSVCLIFDHVRGEEPASD